MDDELVNRLNKLDQLLTGINQSISGFGIDFANTALGISNSEKLPPEDLMRLLLSSEPISRLAALHVLADTSCREAPLCSLAKELAFDDPDSKVQEAALEYLIKISQSSMHSEMAQFFARLVSHSDVSDKIRKLAYVGLIHLFDLAVDWQPDLNCLRFPDDVNWDFVRRSLTGNGQ